MGHPRASGKKWKILKIFRFSVVAEAIWGRPGAFKKNRKFLEFFENFGVAEAISGHPGAFGKKWKILKFLGSRRPYGAFLDHSEIFEKIPKKWSKPLENHPKPLKKQGSIFGPDPKNPKFYSTTKK